MLMHFREMLMRQRLRDVKEGKVDRVENDEPTKLYIKYSMTFGYGSRVCLGNGIALMKLHNAPR
ncbi:hypothetical protein BDU57DRAFT_516906 [Ampelomyces quisqualis]|uniref:Cytochrome P450 n=1 Tax=Ampelomyces quisqualis TaxID=50730 RepID=A0A6A5QRQ8_AMPQU|nr:hypothetical protein BDU57DRAFT_516906 [Ampelomyces quisqualis]